MDRESLNLEWSKIEDALTSPRHTTDWQLEWGSKREEFYNQIGHIPISNLDSQRLKSLKNIFLGERIFVIGNGPSLNNTPLELLANEFTFVTNRSYLLFDRIKWRPTFYTALDWRVVPDVAHEINLLNGMICFFEERFRGLLRNDTDVFWYTHSAASNAEEKRFAYNIDNGVRGAGSVIGSAIQIAYFLGFREIYLIGCDLGYKVTETINQEGADLFGNGVKIHLTSTQDDDANHFDKRYFGKGRRWHDPNVKRMISGHEQCKQGVESGGGKIFNATIGGELEVYPRVNFRDLFPKKAGILNPRKSIESIINTVKSTNPIPFSEETIVGPFLRCEKAHYDETDVISLLFENQSSGFMIDVGAHRGTSCLPFLKYGWNILAFEPDPENRSSLIKMIDDNNFKNNITVDIRAVGVEQRKGVPYYQSQISSGISGLSAFHDTHNQRCTIDVVPLRDVLDNQYPTKVDFLKIDTEGHDLFVLQSFPWERTKPTVIECEFEDSKTIPLGYSFNDIANYLVNKGYTVYVSEWHPIVRYGIRHDWNRLMRYPCELSDSKGWGNLIAFQNPINENELSNAVGRVLKTVVFSQPELAVPNKKVVIAPKQASPSLTLDINRLKESLSVFRLQKESNNIIFSDANAFFRRGDYSKAILMYLMLYEKRPHSVYINNALMSANRLGITSIKNIEDLVQVLK